MYRNQSGQIEIVDDVVYDDETIIYFAVKKGWDKK